MDFTALETKLISVIGILTLGWIGWISLSVVDLSQNTRENEAQWRAINKLRDFHAIPHPKQD